MERIPFIANPTIDDIFETNKQARAMADQLILTMKKKS